MGRAMTAADLAAAARRNQIPLGILYMVASTVMFGGVNAIVKWELATYPVGEVAFFRSLFAFATVALLICRATAGVCCGPGAIASTCNAGCRSSAR